MTQYLLTALHVYMNLCTVIVTVGGLLILAESIFWNRHLKYCQLINKHVRDYQKTKSQKDIDFLIKLIRGKNPTYANYALSSTKYFVERRGEAADLIQPFLVDIGNCLLHKDPFVRYSAGLLLQDLNIKELKAIEPKIRDSADNGISCELNTKFARDAIIRIKSFDLHPEGQR